MHAIASSVQIIPLDVDQKVRKQILLELRTLYKTTSSAIVPYHGAFYKVPLASSLLPGVRGWCFSAVVFTAVLTLSLPGLFGWGGTHV